MPRNFVEFVISFGLVVSAIGLLLELFAHGDIRRFGRITGLYTVLISASLTLCYVLIAQTGLRLPIQLPLLALTICWGFATTSFRYDFDLKRGRTKYD